MIKISNLSFSYNDDIVLKDVTMEIHQGDYIALIGSNGSGKSTLVKLALGLLEADSGTITNTHGSIAYVPQQGLEDVRFPVTVNELLTFRLPRRKNKKTIIQDALKTVGLQDEGNRLISNLSGGQRQRVLIARELMVKPDVLILDEPSTGLDQDSIQHLYNLLKRLNQDEKMTIILVTHHINEDDLDGLRVFEIDHHHVEEVDHA